MKEKFVRWLESLTVGGWPFVLLVGLPADGPQ
jgi:hypothetical protein